MAFSEDSNQTFSRKRIALSALAMVSLTACQQVPVSPGFPGSAYQGVTSFGGTDGFVTSISSTIEDTADQLRNSAPYQAQVLRNYSAGPGFYSYSLAAARIEYAHALNITGNGEIIAIRDIGFDPAHIEFTGKTIYYTEPTTAETITIDDHGTAVAALAAGVSTSGETLGAAPNASLLLSSWEDEDEFTGVRAAETKNAIVQNNSWGYICEEQAFDQCGVNDNNFGLISTSYREALKSYAGDEGVVVFSTSNENEQSQATIMAALPQLLPELEQGWLAVINLGRDYDAAADDLFNDGPQDVSLISSGCLEAARWCIGADGTSYIAVANNPSGYDNGTGTSYAAPRVSGAVALLAQAFPALSAAELRNRLLVTADNDFFAEDTDSIKTMTFAEGVTHDYHWLYGHGFLDVRAALLPIGGVSTTSVNGSSLSMDQPVLVSGNATGDALKTSLASIEVYGTDALGGGFTADGAALVATRSLNRLPASFAEFSAEPTHISTFDNANGRIVPLGASETARVDILIPHTDEGDLGVRLSTDTSLSSGDVSLALSHVVKGSDTLGLSAIGGDILGANQLEFEANWTQDLSDSLSLSVSSMSGRSQNDGSALLRDLSDIRYSAVAVNIAQENVVLRGDRLSVYARQPVAVTDGSAVFTVATADGSGASTMFDILLDFAPSQREVEIGFDYATAGSLGEEWTFSASHRQNAGNIAGAEEFALGASVSLNF